MPPHIDRRSLLLTATLGLGAYAIPGFAQGPNWIVDAFTHSVASGEPTSDGMLLWTRYVPKDGRTVKLRVEVSETPGFARVVAGGEAVTGPWRDHTAKISVTGLKPGTRYHYRFVAPDGRFSPVGRARTLPEEARQFRIGIFSCSNLAFGHFNAYANAAARDDLDLAVHLGDYIYEYAPGVYPSADVHIAARLPQPMAECVHLADYRLRYASYRADPDLQALHAAVPMLIEWDDHEFANDAWEGGAENHGANEGEWSIRRGAAIQAWREWMPVSDEPYAAYDLGGLATFFRTESRVNARTRPYELAPLFKNPDPAAALKAFRDGPWMDPTATMLGGTQENWLAHELARSVRSGRRWQVVGFGTIMGETRSPDASLGWLKPDASPFMRNRVNAGAVAAKAGLPFNLDNWGGYPAARARFLKSAQAAGANLVVLSGDSHNGWAYDLGQDGKPAGVEFAGHAVSSAGFESSFAADPAIIARATVAANPELKWCDTSRRGYMALTLTPDRVSNDWVFVDTVRERNPRARVGHTAVVQRGRNVMV
ncbi:alkaline phosphatase D family protein [Sphingomonas sp. M1-B02]|uniref:alkaline phosphatase D family protein n=1 Tax=Sphingomonas sp. M1-B02 TaxID=3114300 RepID=UPI0022405001|nr:alkaline phosphatase D family protein [Sphingomonas sp. S6-11]UZK64899.1 alkaline phosphatase D family protein [Sphingomonas sp. S6-11]